MTIIPPGVLFRIFGLSLILLAHVVSAQDFSIKLVRQASVGETYRINAHGSSEQVIVTIADGQALPEERETTSIVLEAKAEVLETTTKGREKRTSLMLTKAVRTVQGMTGELLPVGTVVIAERIGLETAFTVEGKPVAPEVKKSLDVIISMESDEGSNDDVIFGTGLRQRVGDSWPVNAKAAAEDFSEKGKMKVNEQSFKGKTTLVEVVKTAVGDSLRLDAIMDFSDITIELPPEMTMEKSAFTARMSGLFPVDTTKRALTKSMVVEGHFTMGGKTQGHMVQLVMTVKQASDITFTLP